MAKLAVRFPQFSDRYDGNLIRLFVRTLEFLFNRISVDATRVITEIASNYTISNEDSLLLVNTSSGNVTITLPESASLLVNERFMVIIKKVTATNNVIVVRSGSDLIDGATSLTIASVSGAARLRAVPGGWVTV